MTVLEAPRLLHITHARQDDRWVEGVLLPALGLTEGQYWTRAEDDLGALKLDEIERAVRTCRYTLLVASSAARVDQWTQFASVLVQHLELEDGKPRLLLVARDFVPGSDRARELPRRRTTVRGAARAVGGYHREVKRVADRYKSAGLVAALSDQPGLEPSPGSTARTRRLSWQWCAVHRRKGTRGGRSAS